MTKVRLNLKNDQGAYEMNEALNTKLKEIIARVMRVDITVITEQCSTNTISAWDSLGHIRLVLALEEEFNLILNENQIEQMTSFVNICKLFEQIKVRE